ncbi:MAG: integration host factor [Actinomycetota bacterium]
MNNPPPQIDSKTRRENGLKAVAARQERAEIKRRLKSGALDLRSLLSLESGAKDRMLVVELLESLPFIGEVRATELMEGTPTTP